MKQPENMDASECSAKYVPTDDELRTSMREWLDEQPDFDAGDFFECYIDPAGPFRYCGSFDPWDGINYYLDNDPHFLSERLREYQKECL